MPRLPDVATTFAGGTLLLTAALLANPSTVLAQQCVVAEDIAPIEDRGLKHAFKKQLGLTTADVTCGVQWSRL